jgi:S-DNA-T family DNA segregation ATPase FtsK/SpoIIIE
VDTAAAGGPTDLDVLVEAANRLSDTLGCAPGAPIWLPPLPDRVRLSDLPERLGTTVAWGLVDQPAEQRQQPLELDLASGGSMLLAGMARSGRTTAAVALATAAAARLGPDDFHLWAVDAGGGLADLARLPHCGAVVPVTDLDRLDRLIDHVNKEVTRRRAARGHAGAAMMLVLDSWEGFVGAAGDSDGGRRVDAVLRLAAEGPAARLRLLVTCERAGLTGRLASACSDRLVLRLADRADYAMLGLPARALPTRLPPGRGLRTDDLAFAQLAEADPETTAVARGWPTAAAGARRFAPLPERVSLPSLPRGPNRKGRIVVGVGGDHVAPLGLDIDELGGSVLVAGPPRSGRSTTLAVVAEQLVAEGRQTAGSPRPVLVLCPRRSALSEVPGVTAVPTSDQQRAADILAATAGSDGSGAHVVVDDVDLLMDGPLTDRLEVLVRAATDNGSVVALAGQTDPLLAAFRGPVVEARRAGVGILLRPMSSRDGDLLGLRLPRSSGGEPPGRGWLAARGELTRVQVATPGNRPITAASRCPVAAPVALP